MDYFEPLSLDVLAKQIKLNLHSRDELEELYIKNVRAAMALIEREDLDFILEGLNTVATEEIVERDLSSAKFYPSEDFGLAFERLYSVPPLGLAMTLEPSDWWEVMHKFGRDPRVVQFRMPSKGLSGLLGSTALYLQNSEAYEAGVEYFLLQVSLVRASNVLQPLLDAEPQYGEDLMFRMALKELNIINLLTVTNVVRESSDGFIGSSFAAFVESELMDQARNPMDAADWCCYLGAIAQAKKIYPHLKEHVAELAVPLLYSLGPTVDDVAEGRFVSPIDSLDSWHHHFERDSETAYEVLSEGLESKGLLKRFLQ